MHVKKTLSATAVACLAVLGVAAPAGASEPGVSSVPQGSARPSAVGESQPAAVDDSGVGSVTGSAAASVGFRISNAQCFSNDFAFTADTFETGRSGVQQFRQKAQLQEFVGGRWVRRSGVATVTSQAFPNDFRSFHFVRDWDGTHVVTGRHWRVVWQGLYFNGFGQTIARTRPISVTC